jgi:hypothetical protein
VEVRINPRDGGGGNPPIGGGGGRDKFIGGGGGKLLDKLDPIRMVEEEEELNLNCRWRR